MSAENPLRTVAFLLHLNRSGSTLLSKLLDSVGGVGVTIEGGLPDDLIIRRVPISDRSSLDAALDQIFSQRKFSEWKIDRGALRARLERSPYPIGFPCVLRAVLAEYFRGRDVSVAIYKRGGYYSHIPQLRTLFPDAKFIATIRDPRAVYNSQRARNMTYSPVQFARGYNGYCGAMRRHEGEADFYVNNFADLIVAPDEQVERICAFLGLRSITRGSSDYSERIPESQQPLHDRLSKEIDTNANSEWRTELDEVSIICIETICAEAMAHFGYEPLLPGASPLERTRAVAYFGARLAVEYPFKLGARLISHMRS